MNNQLSNISTQYRKFTKGQYVKSSQFNEFLDFFEDQDRLSRVMLQGVGIVCGLKPQPIFIRGQLNSIQLSQGAALTTDGDLLTLNKTSEVSKELYVSDLKTIKIESKDFTHFKVYDNFKVRYPAFSIGATGQIELWELATSEEANSDFKPINNLTNLEDKYLLLYLESYEKEIKPCRGVDCDNHGVQQIRNLKVLVTTSAGIKYIIEKDKIQKHPLFIKNILEAEMQERVIVERLILDRGIETPVFSSDLKYLYQRVLQNNGFGKIVFEKVNAISNLLGIEAVDHQSFKSKLEECLTQKTGFQYVYDVVKDLTETYSEIIAQLPHAFTKCFPDLLSFPKHIMLGKLISNTQLDSCRHQFYNSPVLDDEKAVKKIRLLINRFRQQTQNFRYSDRFEDESSIKITPSQKLNSLANKAIPFYYNITDEFLKAWNFDKTSNRSSKDNLAYNVSLLSSDDHIQKPLDFNIDKNTFYNIEGHQGMDYYEAFKQIKQIKDKQQLGFDVMGLSLLELKNNKDLYKAYFNEYVDKNPGLEHNRGVGRGDTFIMVYDTAGTKTQVVADFTLPYICCTPKIDVKLTLPDSVICSKAPAVPFTVFPMNGDVKAVVDEGLNGGVEIIDGKYFFNPSLVSSVLYNEDISFTVNGKPTDCIIRVTPQSYMKVEVISVVNEGSSATVNFKVSGEGFTNYTYTWDFWDNGNWVNLDPDGEGNLKYIFKDINPDIIPTIKVNVSNSGCTQNIAIDDWYDAPSAPTVVIDSVEFSKDNCCDGTPVYIEAEINGPTSLPLSAREFTLEGMGYGGTSLLYSWTKTKGPKATLAGVDKPNLKVTNLAAGDYGFRLTILDQVSGAFVKAETGVTVYSDDK
ncbi:PKD domain-containing protein [Chryseobacterium terrae]|uniref:PKD domain-containing protein n=1 Tax=Chryseobacterium terrae TaxID=3163299 RepID=A0ABW8Y0Q9_9FLAO